MRYAHTITAMQVGTLMTIGAMLAGCNDNNPVAYIPAAQQGSVETEKRYVTDFDAIAVAGAGELLIQQTGIESLEIVAAEHILPLLRAEVRNGRLTLGPRDGVQLPRNTEITYRLTVKNLRQIGTAGAVAVDATGIEGERLEVTMAGAGHVQVAGSVEQQTVRIAGAGRYEGARLDSRQARVQLSGAAGATLCVSESLTGSLTGACTVEYIGNPELSVSVSQASTLRRR
jgi:hypothetical protein